MHAEQPEQASLTHQPKAVWAVAGAAGVVSGVCVLASGHSLVQAVDRPVFATA